MWSVLFQANGFFGARGVSGYIPDVYTLIARQFFSQVCKKGQDFRISIFEYYRKHWTFHCKGLWFYMPNCDFPVLTLIGSPNFGMYRAMVFNNVIACKRMLSVHTNLFKLDCNTSL